MRTFPALFAAAVLITGGCARVDVRRVTDADRANPDLRGVHFYEPWPYLVVTEQTAAGVTTYSTAVVYLPRTTSEFVAHFKPGWGTVEGALVLKDGWMLTSLGAKMDSKGPETITAITGLINAVLPEIRGAARNPLVPLPPGMYRIEFDKEGFASGLVPVFQ